MHTQMTPFKKNAVFFGCIHENLINLYKLRIKTLQIITFLFKTSACKINIVILNIYKINNYSILFQF